MGFNYLHTCMEQFGPVSRARYGKPFDLDAIEKDVRSLAGKRKLTYADLRYFNNSEHWWFEQYWAFPSSEDVGPRLAKASFDFWHLSKGNEGSAKERGVIEALLRVFLSIELVSIILRFVRPDSFGILSPPVERVLDVRRGSDAVSTYQHYLENLRAIRNHYDGLKRAADADMALWVLHEKCYSIPPEDPQIKEEYERDSFMLQLRAANLVAPLDGLPLPRLARALQKDRPDLAALIACYAFEEGLQQRAGLLKVRVTIHGATPRRFPNAGDYIQSLLAAKAIFALQAGSWMHLKAIRDKMFHASIKAPSLKETEDLISGVLEMEQGNEALRGKKRQ